MFNSKVFKKDFLNTTYLISLAFALVSCVHYPVGEPVVQLRGPYVMAVYPETKNSGLDGLNNPITGDCRLGGCGKLTLINREGDSTQVETKGMVEERYSFSSDSTKIAFTDLDGITIVDDGHIKKIEIEDKSPIARYLKIKNSGDIVYINHQSIDEMSENFSSLVYTNVGGEEVSGIEPINGILYECYDELMLFSTGEIDSYSQRQYYPEYVYKGGAKFKELRKGGEVSREILGFNCRGGDSFDYLALIDGNIRSGVFSLKSGFIDNEIIYSWDEFASNRDEDPILVDEGSIWALNTLGEMRVFDRSAPNYRIAWDMYPYFEKVSVSDIAAKSIQRDGSAFFFGIPKGKDKGWVMMEVDLKSGEILRSVHLPILDEHYPDGEVQDIYMGDVDGFRKWADTQPKFDYTAMN